MAKAEWAAGKRLGSRVLTAPGQQTGRCSPSGAMKEEPPSPLPSLDSALWDMLPAQMTLVLETPTQPSRLPRKCNGYREGSWYVIMMLSSVLAISSQMGSCKTYLMNCSLSSVSVTIFAL